MNAGNIGFLAMLGIAVFTVAYQWWQWQHERPHEHLPPPTQPSPPRRRRRNGPNTRKQKIIDELDSATAECSHICFEKILPEQEIFSCVKCYAIYHLNCIKKWARQRLSDSSGGDWTCPACNHKFYSNPNNLEYKCFCGGTRNPQSMPALTPHCCTMRCSRPNCTELCHPGPCDV